MKESDLQREFSKFGRVETCRVIVDRAGHSKGYAFVTIEKPEDGIKAQEETNAKLQLGT